MGETKSLRTDKTAKWEVYDTVSMESQPSTVTPDWLKITYFGEHLPFYSAGGNAFMVFAYDAQDLFVKTLSSGEPFDTGWHNFRKQSRVYVRICRDESATLVYVSTFKSTAAAKKGNGIGRMAKLPRNADINMILNTMSVLGRERSRKNAVPEYRLQLVKFGDEEEKATATFFADSGHELSVITEMIIRDSQDYSRSLLFDWYCITDLDTGEEILSGICERDDKKRVREYLKEKEERRIPRAKNCPQEWIITISCTEAEGCVIEGFVGTKQETKNASCNT